MTAATRLTRNKRPAQAETSSAGPLSAGEEIAPLEHPRAFASSTPVMDRD
jgi:hypothetical protein